MEVNTSLTAALGAHKHVEQWAKPYKPPFDINLTPMRPIVRKEAKGVVLVIAPFNYPLWLVISPLLGALSAGNSVCIKPSEQTPEFSKLITELFPKYIDTDIISVVNGAISETTKLLEIQWDHILFTGSGRVGRVVSEAAAKHMTPVTLELGGKSPVFVDPTCDLPTAANRILWGKLANAGQTCTAPDYVLVPRGFQDKFIEALLKAYNNFFPPDAPASQRGVLNMGRLISSRSVDRVAALVSKTKGQIVLGGKHDAEDRFFAPTIVKDVLFDDSLMSEELFAPVLPIVPVDSFDDAIAFVNANDHPLALYVFSNDNAFKSKVVDNTQSGGFAANEVILQSAAEGIPFGGIGPAVAASTAVSGASTLSHTSAPLLTPRNVIGSTGCYTGDSRLTLTRR
ncbi:Aldehyde/histidinol dehydrogenase [Multifurca ochricompacta]|uniref:Aldehyde/histidinol dehydrogenase n=1 Tax=Multifurca ochricompacta TaxID=376703 RepID=A0AAD4QKL9_9AGAM|nr:Aldehyde/histidinol dehydrogenase [Multifurca ochricompacta]